MTQHRGYFACNTSGISAYWDISKDTTTEGTRTLNLLIQSQTPYPLGHAVFYFFFVFVFVFVLYSLCICLYLHFCLCLVVRWTACPKFWHEKGDKKISNCHVIKHSLV